MFSRILALALCFGMFIPVSRSQDEPAPSTAASEPSKKEPAAKNASASAPASPSKLSQEEESSLSARAEEPGPEVAGGALSNLHLTYAVIALAAIILVLLIK